MTNAEYQKRWRQAHPEKSAGSTRKYRMKHRDRYNTYMREYMRRRRAQKEEQA